MSKLKIDIQQIAAAQAGMDVKTARKYIKIGRLPSELKKAHNWQKREDPFSGVWEEVDKMLEQEPLLQAKTVFIYLQRKYPGRYRRGQLRTLQRRFKRWRAMNGVERNVMFGQIHKPGIQSQSDYTDMKKLSITIQGEPFPHLLFHFMLVYSRWEYVEICYTESFESLTAGFENAVWRLGFVANDHRTDNLSAATRRFADKRTFTDKWAKVMKHYNISPSRNNPGESHENGSIEKSHDLFKNAVNQQLMLRGSRNFESIDNYHNFLKNLTNQRNKSYTQELHEEIAYLKALPKDRWYSPKQVPVRVSPFSTVQILGVPYSVPSRLISLTLRALIYPNKIELYYGQCFVQKMTKLENGFHIDYRHIIGSLIRKPGAFKNYQYREALFPRVSFRKACDILCKSKPTSGHKHYLQLLYLAKQNGEQLVNTAIELLLEEGVLPLAAEIKPLLNMPIKPPEIQINAPNLASYNELCCQKVVAI